MYALTDSETLGDSGEIPNRLNSNLGDCQFAALIDANLAIGNETSLSNTVFQLRQLHMSFRDGNRGPDLDTVLVHGLLVQPGS